MLVTVGYMYRVYTMYMHLIQGKVTRFREKNTLGLAIVYAKLPPAIETGLPRLPIIETR